MKTYASLREAFAHLPICLIGSSVDDESGIAAEAGRNAENPLAILRDLVQVELDLIAEGEVAYLKKDTRAIEVYHLSVRASC